MLNSRKAIPTFPIDFFWFATVEDYSFVFKNRSWTNTLLKIHIKTIHSYVYKESGLEKDKAEKGQGSREEGRGTKGEDSGSPMEALEQDSDCTHTHKWKAQAHPYSFCEWGGSNKHLEMDFERMYISIQVGNLNKQNTYPRASSSAIAHLSCGGLVRKAWREIHCWPWPHAVELGARPSRVASWWSQLNQHLSDRLKWRQGRLWLRGCARSPWDNSIHLLQNLLPPQSEYFCR